MTGTVPGAIERDLAEQVALGVSGVCAQAGDVASKAANRTF